MEACPQKEACYGAGVDWGGLVGEQGLAPHGDICPKLPARIPHLNVSFKLKTPKHGLPKPWGLTMAWGPMGAALR